MTPPPSTVLSTKAGMKSLSLRGKPGRPKRATDCGTAISITLSFSAAAGCVGGDGCELGLGRQLAEQFVEHAGERGGVDVADHDDAQVVLGEGARPVGREVVARDLLDRWPACRWPVGRRDGPRNAMAFHCSEATRSGSRAA